jgi:hypothetical protein
MNLVDSTIRYAIPTFGVGIRWLKEELHARGVSARITEGCLRELALDADAAAKLEAPGPQSPEPYVSCVRRQIAARAEFLKIWTLSDDRIDVNDPITDRLVRVARNYALPRPWKLLEPVAAECRRPTPTYLYWASAT